MIGLKMGPNTVHVTSSENPESINTAAITASVISPRGLGYFTRK